MKTDFRAAAEALGRSIALGDRAELAEFQADWSHDDRIAWYEYLDTPTAVALQTRGYHWAPGGQMWQAAAPFRQRLDAEARAARGTARRHTPVDQRRSAIASAVFAALRHGEDGSGAERAALRANLRLSVPLPLADVNAIVAWARQRATEHARG